MDKSYENAVYGCRFCAAGNKETNDFWNQPLLETRNFFVVPSLGALVPGWLLIVPKDHYISMKELPVYLLPELADLKQDVETISRKAFGLTCNFEHGPAEANRQAGCGVDHAHLHVLSTNFDLLTLSAPFLPADAAWVNIGFEQIAHFVPAYHDYLYFERNSNGALLSLPEIGSQVFRQALANVLGFQDSYSWRDHPRLENVKATADRFLLAKHKEGVWQKMTQITI